MFCWRLRNSEPGGHFERESVQCQEIGKRKWLLAEMSEKSRLEMWTRVTGWLSGSEGGSADRSRVWSSAD